MFKYISEIGASIILRNGYYYCSNTVKVKPYQTIHGNGLATIFIAPSAQFKLDGNTDSNYHLNWHDFIFRVNGDRTTHAIELNDLVYSNIRNVTVRSDDGTTEYNGMVIKKSLAENESFSNVISECLFQRACITFDNSPDNRIVNNKFWGNSIASDGAVMFLNNCSNTLFSGNHCIGTTNHYAVYGVNCNDMQIVNNYSDRNNYGMHFNVLTNSVVSGNLFYLNAIDPISIGYCRQVNFNGNLFDNCCNSSAPKGGDITFENEATGVTISGNTHTRDTNYATLSPVAKLASNDVNIQNIYHDETIMYDSRFSKIQPTNNWEFHNVYPSTLFN